MKNEIFEKDYFLFVFITLSGKTEDLINSDGSILSASAILKKLLKKNL